MWSRLSLLLGASFLTADASAVVFCPEQKFYNDGCSTPVIVLLDASNDISPNSVSAYMYFVFQNMLPHWALLGGQTVSHTSYGATLTAPRNPFTSVYEDTCHQVDEVQADMFEYGGKHITLKDALVQLEANYHEDIAKYKNLNLLIFSATSNVNEINDAGAFVKSSNLSSVAITVVGLCGSYQPWNGFPAYKITTPTPQQIYTNDLERRAILCYTCGGCATPPDTWTPTATPPSPPSTTPLPPLTTPAPALGMDGPKCDTNPTTLWLDIMLLFDASTGDGYDALHWMLLKVNNEMSGVFFVKRGQEDYGEVLISRLGLATYSNRTRIYGNLYTMDRDDLADIKLYADTVPDTNLDDALTKMSAQFDDPTAHRSNAKKVIVVLGHEYYQGTYPSPVAAANKFKESGGVIVVYDYFGYDATLKSIASEGFYLQSQYETRSLLSDALVKVNCFCPSGTVSFTNYGNSATPTSGCYFSNGPANYQVASNRCKTINSGTVAQNKNPVKAQFLQNQDPNSIIWTGATLDAKSGNWQWANGENVDMSSVTWVGPPQFGQNCAALNQDGRWLATDCRNSYDSVCEAVPCGTKHYCK